jgi:hypothetical protein
VLQAQGLVRHGSNVRRVLGLAHGPFDPIARSRTRHG